MMITTIQKLLMEADVNDWTILEKKCQSRELFFIRKELDMNRSKDVDNYTVTVYKDYLDDCKEYRGSATIVLGNNMTKAEIAEKIKAAGFSAGFVKNPYYPIPSFINPKVIDREDRLSEKDLVPVLSAMRDSLYKNDIHPEGGINSAEIFVNQFEYRFVSSSGTDVRYRQNRADIELICDWKNNGNSVELYNMFSFTGDSLTLIEEECKTQLDHCKLRAEAVQAPRIESVNVILRDNAVRDVMEFYTTHSDVKGIYEGTAQGKKGAVFQGDDVVGDLLDITLDPVLPHSPYSAPIDKDGVELKKIRLYEKGKLLCYHGSQQYSYYLEEKVSGIIPNTVIGSGEQSVEDWRKRPYVEIMTFSDFQMDPITGDFGGEIRLAVYFDGEKKIPVSGASISASLFTVQKNLYLSRERLDIENYSGPRYLMFPHGTISGE